MTGTAYQMSYPHHPCSASNESWDPCQAAKRDNSTLYTKYTKWVDICGWPESATRGVRKAQPGMKGGGGSRGHRVVWGREDGLELRGGGRPGGRCIKTASEEGLSARPANLGVHFIWWWWHGNTKSTSNSHIRHSRACRALLRWRKECGRLWVQLASAVQAPMHSVAYMCIDSY